MIEKLLQTHTDNFEIQPILTKGKSNLQTPDTQPGYNFNGKQQATSNKNSKQQTANSKQQAAEAASSKQRNEQAANGKQLIPDRAV